MLVAVNHAQQLSQHSSESTAMATDSTKQESVSDISQVPQQDGRAADLIDDEQLALQKSKVTSMGDARLQQAQVQEDAAELRGADNNSSRQSQSGTSSTSRLRVRRSPGQRLRLWR